MIGTGWDKEPELHWLAQQKEPVWWGHLERGEPISDPKMRMWVEEGYIEVVREPRLGYIITEKGRQRVDADKNLKRLNRTATG